MIQTAINSAYLHTINIQFTSPICTFSTCSYLGKNLLEALPFLLYYALQVIHLSTLKLGFNNNHYQNNTKVELCKHEIFWLRTVKITKRLDYKASLFEVVLWESTLKLSSMYSFSKTVLEKTYFSLSSYFSLLISLWSVLYVWYNIMFLCWSEIKQNFLNSFYSLHHFLKSSF